MTGVTRSGAWARRAAVVVALALVAVLSVVAFVVVGGRHSGGSPAAPAAGTAEGGASLPPKPVTTGEPSKDLALAGRRPTVVGFRPVSIEIPSLGVTAPMDAQVPDADNVLGVPADPRRLGWRLNGALAADPDGTLLAYGHVVNRGYGRGALYDLKNLPAGGTVVVVGALGERATYVVTASERHHRDAMPVADLLATGGPHRIALYTCDGAKDSTGHRLQRVVVWGTLASLERGVVHPAT